MKKLYKYLWILLGVLSVQEMANGADDVTFPWQYATMSTMYGNLDASRATDGDRGTCSHSSTQTDPWWRLELWQEVQVETIAITNADSNYYHWINGSVIRVGNSPTIVKNPICTVISTIPRGQTANFSCGWMEGRYMFVHITGVQKTLVLCEVKIYGYFTENVALQRFVNASSQTTGVDTRSAVDGSHHTCTQTTEETNPWLVVDLLNEYQVKRVAIANIDDLAAYQRINGAVLRVGNFGDDIYKNPICTENPTVYSGLTETYSCGMVGRYVILHIPGDQRILSICELDVYGELIGNLASNGSTTQSSTYKSYFAEKAINGNRGLLGLPRGCSSTLPETNPWWRLDLNYVYSVSRVVVTNRNDCCVDRINGVEIRIGNSLENNGNNNPICAVIPAIPAGESYSYSCGEMKGRYVNLILPGDMKTLTLCEVEVYGEGPVLKKSVARMMFKSKADLTDQTMRELILEKLVSALADRGLTNVKLSWIQTPVRVIQKVNTPKSCVKVP